MKEPEQIETTFDDAVEVAESQTTVLEDIVSEYIERVKEINEQHKHGLKVEKQTKIGDLISDGKRRDGESQEEYKMRRKAEQLILKHYRKGVRGR